MEWHQALAGFYRIPNPGKIRKKFSRTIPKYHRPEYLKIGRELQHLNKGTSIKAFQFKWKSNFKFIIIPKLVRLRGNNPYAWLLDAVGNLIERCHLHSVANLMH